MAESSTNTTYLFLIRHGENEWTRTSRLAGRTEGVHLNQRGQEQATKLAQTLSEQPITTIYSSPLVRCMETAQPVADTLGLTVQPEAGVLEVDYGEWRGGELKELSKKPEWKAVQHHPSSFRFPGGETLREVQSRAVGTLERIITEHPKTAIAVFSHGDVIRTSLAHYMGTPLDLFQRIVISTASISLITFHDQKPSVSFVNYLDRLPKITVDS